MMNSKKEIWKPYPLTEKYTGDYKLEFSNLGRVRTFNLNAPEGRILKGSLREGYPIISLRLYNDRSPAIQKKVDEYNLRIDLIQKEIRELKKIEDFPEDLKEARISTLNETRLKLIGQRKKYVHRTDKKRILNVHVLVHRAVAELFLTKEEHHEKVIHKDFNKKNNHMDNLEWKTKEETYARYTENPYYKYGLYKAQVYKNTDRSTRTSRNKLVEKEVLYIKQKLAQGKTLKELAQKFNVSDMQIHRIKTGENWSQVKTVSELKANK